VDVASRKVFRRAALRKRHPTQRQNLKSINAPLRERLGRSGHSQVHEPATVRHKRTKQKTARPRCSGVDGQRLVASRLDASGAEVVAPSTRQKLIPRLVPVPRQPVHRPVFMPFLLASIRSKSKSTSFSLSADAKDQGADPNKNFFPARHLELEGDPRSGRRADPSSATSRASRIHSVEISLRKRSLEIHHPEQTRFNVLIAGAATADRWGPRPAYMSWPAWRITGANFPKRNVNYGSRAFGEPRAACGPPLFGLGAPQSTASCPRC